MTRASSVFPELAHVHSVHILPNFASPQGEGVPPSPMGTLMIPDPRIKIRIENIHDQIDKDKHGRHH